MQYLWCRSETIQTKKGNPKPSGERHHLSFHECGPFSSPRETEKSKEFFQRGYSRNSNSTRMWYGSPWARRIVLWMLFQLGVYRTYQSLRFHGMHSLRSWCCEGHTTNKTFETRQQVECIIRPNKLKKLAMIVLATWACDTFYLLYWRGGLMKAK